MVSVMEATEGNSKIANTTYSVAQYVDWRD